MDSAAKDAAQELLVNAVTSHGLQVQPDDILRALNDPDQGPALSEWALEHLYEDNLLTAEELSLYAALDSSGQVDKLAELQDLSTVYPVKQADLEAAVNELKRSTQAINKQTETLRHQQDALSKLAAKEEQDRARRRRLDLAHQRNAQVEQARFAAQVDELSKGIEQSIAQLTRQGQPHKAELKLSLQDALQSDDKLLASLQKLGWELEEPDAEEAQPVEKLKEVCTRLIKVTVQSVRARLDTVYLNSLTAAHKSGSTQTASAADVATLQDEVESLYAEILPVAQMSVEQQHLEPALLATSSKSSQSLGKTATSLIYMDQCLDYLLGRVNRLEARMHTVQAHLQAVQAVVATAKSEMAAQIPQSQTSNRTGSTSTSGKPPITPLRRSDSKSRRRPSGIYEPTPVETLMQTLSLPTEAFEASTTEEKITVLAKQLELRQAKNGEQSRHTQEALEDAVATQIDEARRAIQLLRDSIAAESSFGKVQLIDPDLDVTIQALKLEADDIKRQLQATGRAIPEDGHSEKKDELIERWSS